jgi:hypothetical protein
LSDQIQKNEIGRACTKYEEEERRIQGFGGENYDPGTGRRIILKMDFQEVGCGGMDLINVDQDRDMWQVLLNAVMNLPVP